MRNKPGPGLCSSHAGLASPLSCQGRSLRVKPRDSRDAIFMDDTLLWFLVAVLLACLLASWGSRRMRRDAPADDEEEAHALETALELDRLEAERLADGEGQPLQGQRPAGRETGSGPGPPGASE